MNLPSNCLIVCPYCSKGDELYTIDIDPQATKVRCPKCRRYFSILTRFVDKTKARVDRKGLRCYDFTTQEPGGRLRPRSVRVSRGVTIRPNTWITLVWRGDSLVGIADQTANQGQGAWLEIHLTKKKGTFDRVWKATLFAGFLLAIIQIITLEGKLYDLASKHPVSMIFLLIFALVFFIPPVHWSITTALAEEEEPIEDPFL